MVIVKPGGVGRPGDRHLGEARALAAEEVLHLPVAFGGPLAPGVDVALGGLVGAVGAGHGCRGHRDELLGVGRPRVGGRGWCIAEVAIVPASLVGPGLRNGVGTGRSAPTDRPSGPRPRARTRGTIRTTPNRTETRGPDDRTDHRAPDRRPDLGPADRARRPDLQREPRQARRRDGVAGLLLGPLRRRADAVRGRAVHDDRGDGRREDRPAAVLGRVAARGRRHRGLRVLRPPRPGRDVHAAAVRPPGRATGCG